MRMRIKLKLLVLIIIFLIVAAAAIPWLLIYFLAEKVIEPATFLIELLDDAIKREMQKWRACEKSEA